MVELEEIMDEENSPQREQVIQEASERLVHYILSPGRMGPATQAFIDAGIDSAGNKVLGIFQDGKGNINTYEGHNAEPIYLADISGFINEDSRRSLDIYVGLLKDIIDKANKIFLRNSISDTEIDINITRSQTRHAACGYAFITTKR